MPVISVTLKVESVVTLIENINMITLFKKKNVVLLHSKLRQKYNFLTLQCPTHAFFPSSQS